MGYHPIVMSIFGDWFFADPLLKIYRLDLATGKVNQITDTLKEFQRNMYGSDELEAWFRKSLAYESYDAGLRVGEGCCLGFKVYPVLGGELQVGNVTPVSLRVYQSIQADVHRQLAHHSVSTAAADAIAGALVDITFPKLDLDAATTKSPFKRRSVRKWRHRRF